MRPKKIRYKGLRYKTVEKNTSSPPSLEDSFKEYSPAGLPQCWGTVLYTWFCATLWCLLLEKSVSGTQKPLTQELPCQVQESTKASASDDSNGLRCLDLLLCHFIPNLRVFLLASAPVSLAASGDLCPVLSPWKWAATDSMEKVQQLPQR